MSVGMELAFSFPLPVKSTTKDLNAEVAEGAEKCREVRGNGEVSVVVRRTFERAVENRRVDLQSST